jgi:peptidoglycan-associated lipoprotein
MIDLYSATPTGSFAYTKKGGLIMSERITFKILLICILMFSLTALVSCGKKTPGPGDGAGPAGMSETEVEMGVQKTDKQKSAIEEEELSARQKAQLEERQADQEAARAAQKQFVNEKIYFGFDDSALSPEARNVLKAKVQYLRANPDKCVVIEGHCDERGTDEYNLALGSRRAESVKEFMVKAGISPSRLTTISYGEEKPAVAASSENAWARNRRAEFKFTNCR